MNDYESSLFPVRRDLVKTWQQHLASMDQSSNSEGIDNNLRIDAENSIVRLKPSSTHSVGIVIPFKDKIHLLEDCIKSLVLNEEEIAIKIYAVNNGSIEPSTFEGLDRLKNKYQELFVRIDFPGEFNYAKINNYAVVLLKKNIFFF